MIVHALDENGIKPCEVIKYCRNWCLLKHVYKDVILGLEYILVLAMSFFAIKLGYRVYYYGVSFLLIAMIQLFSLCIPTLSLLTQIEAEVLDSYSYYMNPYVLSISTFIIMDTADQLYEQRFKKWPNEMLYELNTLIRYLRKYKWQKTVYKINILSLEILEVLTENKELMNDEAFFECGHTNKAYIKKFKQVKRNIYRHL